MTTKIRVYKVISPAGEVTFASKEHDGRGGAEYGSMEVAIRTIKVQIERLYKESVMEQVSIDFSPFHDIECPSGLLPKRCVALSDDEQEKFWRLFKK